MQRRLTWILVGSALWLLSVHGRLSPSWQQLAARTPWTPHRRPSWRTASRSARAARQAKGEGRDDEKVARNAPTAEAQLPFESMTTLRQEDVRCLATRQLFYKPEDVEELVLGVGRRCKYNWPQAVLCDPLKNSYLGSMVFITCPLLAGAIEEYESEGAVEEFNVRLSEDDTWQAQIRDTDTAHNALRSTLLENREGELAELAEKYGSSSVESITRRGLDVGSGKVRCLHAQAADELVRGSNVIGKQVLEDLQSRGVEVLGTQSCCDFCNMEASLDALPWHFSSHKRSRRKRFARQQEMERDGEGGPQSSPE